jgi:SAM-dependent methyltransferase
LVRLRAELREGTPSGDPRADIRGWLTSHADAADPYTRQRIDESYDHFETVMAPFGHRGGEQALDVGCGTAFNSFALAARFDRVTAIDPSLPRIRSSRKLAKRAGISTIAFERRAGEAYERDTPFDLVYCNIMSDLTNSRRALIERLVRAGGSAGEIFYAETCEGYAPRELEGCIERRDGRELRVRLRQIVNGFCTRPAFRFFLAGSAEPLFERHGYSVISAKRSVWHGLTCVETLWLRAADREVGAAREPRPTDRDYLARDPKFEEVRREFLAALDGHPPRPEELAERGADPANPLAPFLLCLAMAIETPGARPSEAGWVLARARDKGPLRVRPREPDWDSVAELFDSFRRLCAER